MDRKTIWGKAFGLLASQIHGDYVGVPPAGQEADIDCKMNKAPNFLENDMEKYVYLVKSYDDLYCAYSFFDDAFKAVKKLAEKKGDYPNYMYRWNIEKCSLDCENGSTEKVWQGQGGVVMRLRTD